MEEIKLNEILRFESLADVKIRLNISNSSWNALGLYHNDPQLLLKGNFHNSPKKKWFKKNDIVIGLAQIKRDEWLLIDISRITKSHNKVWDGVTETNLYTFYEHEKLIEFEKYFGRIILRFQKSNAFVTLNGNRINEFIVKEILARSLDNDFFPGYDKVNISWIDLQRALQKDTWRTVLQNQKGVYLLSDTLTGKKYVGSAYGDEMILGRWIAYITNGHGGNTALKGLKFDYIKQNFRYSILDIYKSTTDEKTIIERELWWKEVLQTRKFGYNLN